MFDTLSDKLRSAFSKLSGRGRITESNVKEAMDEVRTALLEADVQLEVVDSFCEGVMLDAVGREVTKSLKPGQQMIGICQEHLTTLMGETGTELFFVDPGPTVIMLCGLQGTGKTTTCGKLAAWMKQRGKKTLVAAARTGADTPGGGDEGGRGGGGGAGGAGGAATQWAAADAHRRARRTAAGHGAAERVDRSFYRGRRRLRAQHACCARKAYRPSRAASARRSSMPLS